MCSNVRPIRPAASIKLAVINWRWFHTFAMNVSEICDADKEHPVGMKIEFEKEEAANGGGLRGVGAFRPAPLQ
jgi:hypothetical protein